jgi:hypothetical protein
MTLGSTRLHRLLLAGNLAVLSLLRAIQPEVTLTVK